MHFAEPCLQIGLQSTKEAQLACTRCFLSRLSFIAVIKPELQLLLVAFNAHGSRRWRSICLAWASATMVMICRAPQWKSYSGMPIRLAMVLNLSRSDFMAWSKSWLKLWLRFLSVVCTMQVVPPWMCPSICPDSVAACRTVPAPAASMSLSHRVQGNASACASIIHVMMMLSAHAAGCE